MTTIEEDVGYALQRRAADVPVEDGLADILAGGTTVLVTRTAQPRSTRRVASMAAASALVVFGSIGLLLTNRSTGESPAVAGDSELTGPGASSDTGSAVSSPVVHLRLGDDEWRLVFADESSPALQVDPMNSTWAVTQVGVASHYSSYLPAAGYSDDEISPIVLISTSGSPPARTSIDVPAHGSRVYVAGSTTTMFSDKTGLAHAVIVDLPNGEHSTIILERMSEDVARTLLETIELLDQDGWTRLLIEQPTPTTIVDPVID